MNIRLREMTIDLARKYYKRFENDPDLFMDMGKFCPYVYNEEKCAQTVERYRRLGRVYLAIMLGNDPIGEIVLKNIDIERKCCTLGIHMQNDSVKNKGYGTQAEILALRYAFDELNLDTVFADAIHKNKRSQRVLKKVGFAETHQDDSFVYYRCDRANWSACNAMDQAQTAESR